MTTRNVLYAVASILLVLTLSACDLFQPKDVLYSVGGSASAANVSILTSSGATRTEFVSPPVYHYNRQCMSGDNLYVSAQNLGSSGEVKVQIDAEGDRLAEDTSTGTAVAEAKCP